MDGYFVSLFGGGALLAGVVVAAVFARTAGRAFVLLAMGAAVAIVTYLVADSRGAFDSSSANGCSDCGESELFNGLQLIGNVLGWTVGVVVGAVGRRLSRAPAHRDQTT